MASVPESRAVTRCVIHPDWLVKNETTKETLLHIVLSYLSKMEIHRPDIAYAVESMSQRVAKIPAPLSGAGITQPAMGPSLTILMQDHADKEIASAIADIKRRMLTDPSACKVVRDVDRIERAHPDKVVLSHSLSFDVYLFMLLMRTLFEAASESELGPNPIVRPPNPHGIKTVTEFFEKFQKIHDHDSPIQAELIAANIALFFNCHQQTESSWNFYFGNISLTGNDCMERFRPFLKHYGLSDVLTGDFLGLYYDLRKYCYLYLNEMRGRPGEEEHSFSYMDKRGIQLQIVIPADLIPEITYACGVFGVPDYYKRSIIETLRSQLAGKGQEAQNLEIQTRILAQALMVPQHGVQIFAHGYGKILRDRELPPEAGSGLETNEFLQSLRKLARAADSAEDSAVCRDLLRKKGEILEQMKKNFADAMMASPPAIPELSEHV